MALWNFSLAKPAPLISPLSEAFPDKETVFSALRKCAAPFAKLGQATISAIRSISKNGTIEDLSESANQLIGVGQESIAECLSEIPEMLYPACQDGPALEACQELMNTCPNLDSPEPLNDLREFLQLGGERLIENLKNCAAPLSAASESMINTIECLTADPTPENCNQAYTGLLLDGLKANECVRPYLRDAISRYTVHKFLEPVSTPLRALIASEAGQFIGRNILPISAVTFACASVLYIYSSGAMSSKENEKQSDNVSSQERDANPSERSTHRAAV